MYIRIKKKVIQDLISIITLKKIISYQNFMQSFVQSYGHSIATNFYHFQKQCLQFTKNNILKKQRLQQQRKQELRMQREKWFEGQKQDQLKATIKEMVGGQEERVRRIKQAILMKKNQIENEQKKGQDNTKTATVNASEESKNQTNANISVQSASANQEKSQIQMTFEQKVQAKAFTIFSQKMHDFIKKKYDKADKSKIKKVIQSKWATLKPQTKQQLINLATKNLTKAGQVPHKRHVSEKIKQKEGERQQQDGKDENTEVKKCEDEEMETDQPQQTRRQGQCLRQQESENRGQEQQVTKMQEDEA